MAIEPGGNEQMRGLRGLRGRQKRTNQTRIFPSNRPTHTMGDNDEDLDMVQTPRMYPHSLTLIPDRAEAQDQSDE